MKLGSDPSSSGGHSHHERGGGNVVWKLYILGILGVQDLELLNGRQTDRLKLRVVNPTR